MIETQTRINSVIHILILTFIVLLLIACSTDSKWTYSERKNSNHFFQSLEAKKSATIIINKGPTPEIISPADIDKIFSFTKTALHEAELVTDVVLDKAHPQLREHFRYEYEKGLRLYLKSLEEPDIVSQLTASTLLDQWGDWFNAHNDEIKIPKNR